MLAGTSSAVAREHTLLGLLSTDTPNRLGVSDFQVPHPLLHIFSIKL